MSVYMRVEGGRRGVRAAGPLVRRYAQRMLRALKLEAAELSLLVCDDRVMRRLNRQHRAIDRPTDVLAFALHEGMPMQSVVHALGDIVISWPTAQRQAREHGWTAERELCLLVAHGLLHLLGFDHATRATERRMMARTHLLMSTALARGTAVEKLRQSGASRVGSRPRSRQS